MAIMNQETVTHRKGFRAFIEAEIKPYADEYDRQQALPESIIRKMAREGYLGATIPIAYGGQGWNQTTYGILLEELGKVCSSCRSLLTVHVSLVAETIVRWGTEEQKRHWLPLLASGEKIAAFCLTEKTAGSDAKNIEASYRQEQNGFVISGAKQWTTFGERADVFLFFAQHNGKISAFLVDREFPGVEVNPIRGMLGVRASMMAQVTLIDCRVNGNGLLGREGAGFFQIVQTALDNGRYSVAVGSLGIAKACLKESLAYVKSRQQFGHYLKDYQLIKQKIANMIAGIKAADLLCYNAARLRDERSPDAVIQTTIAKYFSARLAFESATEGVQIHGAMGCHDTLPVQRYFRDAKIMEIIEGTSEIQQILIADDGISTTIESIIN